MSNEWDMLRVHEFVRNYSDKQDNKFFTSHSPQQAVLGTLLLWLGWLMFNAGSSLGLVSDDGTAIYLSAERAIMNTILAPASGGLFTFFFKKYITGGV